MTNVDYSAYADQPVADNLLAEIREVSIKVSQANQKVADCEAALREAQAEQRHLVEVILPELMERAQTSHHKTNDGVVIELVENIRVSVTDETRPTAIRWLIDNGHSDIVKNQFKIEFGRNEDNRAKSFEEKLKEEEVLYSRVMNVHPQTLQAFVKNQLEAGEEVPMDIFNVYRQKLAKVKFPKNQHIGF